MHIIIEAFVIYMQAKASPRRALFEAGGVIPGDLLLNKLEEIKQSVKVWDSFVLAEL